MGILFVKKMISQVKKETKKETYQGGSWAPFVVVVACWWSCWPLSPSVLLLFMVVAIAVIEQCGGWCWELVGEKKSESVQTPTNSNNTWLMFKFDHCLNSLLYHHHHYDYNNNNNDQPAASSSDDDDDDDDKGGGAWAPLRYVSFTAFFTQLMFLSFLLQIDYHYDNNDDDNGQQQLQEWQWQRGGRGAWAPLGMFVCLFFFQFFTQLTILFFE